MPQVVGDVTVSGQQLGLGIGGPVYVLFGLGDPNVLTNSVLVSASVGSAFMRLDGPDSTHCLYVKTSAGTPGTSGTWTPK